MTKKEALELLQRVCAIYRGTLEEHQQLQTALQTVKECLTVEKEEEKEDGTTKR